MKLMTEKQLFNIDDIVYVEEDGECIERKICRVERFNGKMIYSFEVDYNEREEFESENIGKSVFKTKEEYESMANKIYYMNSGLKIFRNHGQYYVRLKENTLLIQDFDEAQKMLYALNLICGDLLDEEIKKEETFI